MRRALSNPRLEGGFFFLSSVAVGLLNYIFQVRAVSALSISEFGQFSLWISYLSLALVAASVAQNSANFLPVSLSWFRRLTSFAWVLSAVFYSLIYYVKGDLAIGILAFTLGLVYGWLIGQIQVRQMYWVSGIGALAIALSRLAFTIQPEMQRFFQANVFGYYLGFFALSLAVLSRKAEEPLEKKANVAGALQLGFILAFFTAAIPQFDFLVVRFTQDSETLGQFARVSLFYRGLFFLVLILAQWWLPKQIHLGHKVHLTRSRFFGFVAVILLLGGVISWIGPMVVQRATGVDLADYKEWILWSCLSNSFLTLLLLQVQQLCADAKAKEGFLAGAVLLSSFVIFVVFRFEVTTYLRLSAAWNFVFLTVLVFNAKKQDL